LNYKLPPKQKTDICTIMYTSGTTGEPKGVILTNGAIMAQVLAIDHILLLTDKVVNNQNTHHVFLRLNDSVPFLFSLFL
jgi:long-chain acyl-CoA synthetase